MIGLSKNVEGKQTPEPYICISSVEDYIKSRYSSSSFLSVFRESLSKRFPSFFVKVRTVVITHFEFFLLTKKKIPPNRRMIIPPPIQ